MALLRAAVPLVAILTLAGVVELPIAEAGHTPYVGYYVAGTMTCESVTICTDYLNLCTRNLPYYQYDTVLFAWVGINGVCAMSLPSWPTFSITVSDFAGEPVQFFYGTVQPSQGSCGFANGFGTVIVTLPDHCNGHQFVFPYLGAVGGKIVLASV